MPLTAGCADYEVHETIGITVVLVIDAILNFAGVSFHISAIDLTPNTAERAINMQEEHLYETLEDICPVVNCDSEINIESSFSEDLQHLYAPISRRPPVPHVPVPLVPVESAVPLFIHRSPSV